MEGPADDFNGFGEGFNGFPKRLPEDCVEYSIYLLDAKPKPTKELLAGLELVRKESFVMTETLLKEYIWQRDSFKLEVESSKGTPCLSSDSVQTNTLNRNNIPSWSDKLWRFSRR